MRGHDTESHRQAGRVACVTGASGMVGARIAEALEDNGYQVRVLTRRLDFVDSRYEIFHGGLDDEKSLERFLQGGELLFHCAAELRDVSKMWGVNVGGTERILDVASRSSIAYVCYLSSAGVVGRTQERLVTEATPCQPRNAYERSKWEAERMIAYRADWCPTVMLRPTNVIDVHKPGALALPMRRSLIDWARVVLKGGECAHIVHAVDVAAAAVFLTSVATMRPEPYFVSCDEEPFNTYAELWGLCDAVRHERALPSVRAIPHFPLQFAHLLRTAVRGPGNRGDVLYSSAKLRAAGFRFPLGVQGAVRKIVSGD